MNARKKCRVKIIELRAKKKNHSWQNDFCSPLEKKQLSPGRVFVFRSKLLHNKRLWFRLPPFTPFPSFKWKPGWRTERIFEVLYFACWTNLSVAVVPEGHFHSYLLAQKGSCFQRFNKCPKWFKSDRNSTNKSNGKLLIQHQWNTGGFLAEVLCQQSHERMLDGWNVPPQGPVQTLHICSTGCLKLYGKTTKIKCFWSWDEGASRRASGCARASFPVLNAAATARLFVMCVAAAPQYIVCLSTALRKHTGSILNDRGSSIVYRPGQKTSIHPTFEIKGLYFNPEKPSQCPYFTQFWDLDYDWHVDNGSGCTCLLEEFKLFGMDATNKWGFGKSLSWYSDCLLSVQC